MANVNNDDEIEIHNLPEVGTLQAGMMVAVDSQPTGTKCFNLSTALESKASASDVSDLATAVAGKAEASDVNTALEGKVDMPETTPAAGQVLTFDGSDNTWANPPEGVYVLNYTEIGSFTDIDVDRMKAQPTFVRIDAAQSITIKTSLTNTITIPLEIGTMMRLVEQNTAWAVFVAEKVQSYPTGPDNAAFGANTCHVNILLRICRSEVSSTTKVFSCYGDIEDTNALFSESPMPCTIHYQNARGADLHTGDVFTQYTGRATAVQFNSASGKYRRNLLMPEEIQSHDFANDATQEDIQFMGWGVISNRAGYRTINEVPVSNAALSDRVLKVTADGAYGWGNAVGFVKNVGELTDAPTITSTTINNGFATLSTSQSALTIVDRVDLHEVVNFALEISPSVNCTLTIQKQIGYQTPVTLKHSVAGGNTLEAGKTYQVTAVGNCWTMAEFEA